MRFDASGLMDGLAGMERQAKKADKVVRRQGYVFVRLAKKVSFEHAPDPVEILNIGERLGPRLRRARGVTVQQEIGRRISQIGLLARNWRFWKMENNGWNIRVWIIDRVGYSKTVDDRQHLVDQAKALALPRFYAAINKLRDSVVKGFTNG